MSQKIQFRRGTEATRTSVVFDQGEPVWATDSQKFYVGDGVTAGGVLVEGGEDGESFIAIIPSSGSTTLQNGNRLLAALSGAVGKTPYGSSKSATNPYSILLHPGVYSLVNGSSINRTKYVNIIGVGGYDSAIITTPDNNGVKIQSGYCTVKNLTFYGVALGAIDLESTDGRPIQNLNMEDCYLYGASSNSLTVKTTLVNCTFKNIKAVGSFMGDVGFTYRESMTGCIVENCQLGYLAGGAPHHFLSPAGSSPDKNNLIKDCDILTDVGAPFLSVGAYGWDSTNLVKNCYISGYNLDMFNDDSTTVPSTIKLEDCHIHGNIFSFHGTMSNCYINSSRSDVPPIQLNNITNTYPVFYNCTVVASHPSMNKCVTGNAVNRSGLFSHCRFNKFVQTGVTGLFGNQFNIVHPNIK